VPPLAGHEALDHATSADGPAMDTVTSVRSTATDGGAAGRDPAAESDDVVVRGPSIDAETRCIHYGSALDVVALRAPCCDAWYPCHLCHAAVADHPLQVIPRAEHHLPAALCGVCRETMSVPEYLAADSCPSCGAPFNPGCAAHAHVYFAP
jgi:uncharacterized CHY-type Zn-finger protein